MRPRDVSHGTGPIGNTGRSDGECGHGSHAGSQSNRHRVVVIGSGFGGLFGTKALRRAPTSTSRWSRRRPTTSSSRCSTRSRPASCPRARSPRRRARCSAARRTPRCSSARSPTSTSSAGRSPRRCSAAPTVTPYDSLIVAAGAGQSYFGNDHFAEFAPGMKSDRRRPRAARPDLRRLRDGRARRHPRRRRRPPADLRGRRRRPHRRGDGRPDRRARAPHAAARTSARSTPAPPG